MNTQKDDEEEGSVIVSSRIGPRLIGDDSRASCDFPIEL